MLNGGFKDNKVKFLCNSLKKSCRKITSAVSNQSMVGRWYWDIWGYEIARTLDNEFKVEWKVTIISGMWYYHTLEADINIYRLVWATKLSLAVIGLVFPALILGYKSFNCSMYQIPVPTLIEKFVWIYFKQLLLVADSIILWHTNSRSLQSISYQFLRNLLNLYDYPSNS